MAWLGAEIWRFAAPENTPMRIGIVAPEFPPDIGSVETYSYELSAELARRGHEVTVFTHRHIVPA
jgi:hypothetical protein